MIIQKCLQYLFGKELSNVKAQIQGIPGRIAPELVGKDHREIEQLMQTEITKILKSLSDQYVTKALEKISEHG